MRRILLPVLAGALSLSAACNDSTVTANNVAPEAYVQVPTHGTAMYEDEQVAFCGVASDHEDTVDVLSMSLASDLDGLLWSSTYDAEPVGGCEDGSGVALTLAGLSIGTHTLTFRVVDTRGADAEDEVALVVEARPNDAPTCVIETPDDGLVVLEGQAVLFAGAVDDADQAADSLAVIWESDEDGLLDETPADGSGAVGFDTADLSVGDHLVSLTVIDDLGLSDVCFVLVGVDPCEDGDGDGVTNCDGDCDDHDAESYPGADELPDLEDNDCDGTVDEGTVFYDDDGDGYCEGPLSCSDGSLPGDCDDANDQVYPGAPEDGGSGTGHGNGVDDDCDGLVDEGTLEYDDDLDGFSELDGDCDDADPAVHPGALELCDGVDNDCNGTPDDRDLDLDGQVAIACGGDDCDDLDPYTYLGAVEICGNGTDNDCNGTPDDLDADGDGHVSAFCGGGDCNDASTAVHPGAAEICDGQDNDCDGTTDDVDADGDGHAPYACGGDDCDDNNTLAHGANVEVCGNGVDDDCSGLADDLDADGDGFRAAACGGADCDDADAAVTPVSPEICNNGVDDDCSGGIDDADEDGDGFVADACGGEDCDDGDPFVHPAAYETCDGVDEDCDGTVDDRDVDGDGFAPYACGGDDCDDLDALRYPGAPEVYDLTANDCDGSALVDEGLIPEGAVVVVEVMANPAAVGDSAGEWFEVLNAWHLPVNLDTWTVHDDGGDLFEVAAPGGVVIAPGEVAVFCADDDPAANGGAACDYAYDHADFALSDAADTIVLELAGDEVDTLDYGLEFPTAPGAALALDPLASYGELNDVAGNWCTASDPFGDGDLGTPGDVNPPCSGAPWVDGVEPAESVMAGGEAVTIVGDGFTAATAVTVGGNPCAPYVVIDDTSIDCVVPPGNVGDVDVTVAKGPDSDTLADGFRYTGQAVTELSWCDTQWWYPESGAVAAGAPLEVYGRFHAFAVNGDSLTDDAGSLEASDPDYGGQTGYGPLGSDPRLDPGWRWFDASYHDDYWPNEEYVGSFSVDTPGSYQFAYRFTDDGGFHFLYCDAGLYDAGPGTRPGTADGFQIDDLGLLQVN